MDATKEAHGATPEQLKIEIVDAIQSTSPLLKKQVMDELMVDNSNVEIKYKMIALLQAAKKAKELKNLVDECR